MPLWLFHAWLSPITNQTLKMKLFKFELIYWKYKEVYADGLDL